MAVTVFRSMPVRPVRSNALTPMAVTESLRVTEVSFSQPQKALSGIFVTPGSVVTVARVLLQSKI